MIDKLKKYLGSPSFKYILDEKFYAEKHGIESKDLWRHFQKVGFKDALDPNPLVSLEYLRVNFDINSLRSLQDFVENNKGSTSEFFDPQYYYEANPDVELVGVPALKHFLLNGRFEDRPFKSGMDVKYADLYSLNGIELITEINLEEAEDFIANLEINEFNDSWDSSYIVRHSSDLKKKKEIQRYSKGINQNQKGRKKKIVIIGDLGIPQCKKYRVFQKMEYFQTQGWQYAFSHWLDVPRSLSILQDATSLILYRVPLTKITNGYILEARRLGISYGYDIDDPVFDLRVYTQNKNLAFIPKNQAENILSGVEAYSAILSNCQYVITSTPSLQNVAREHTDQPVYLWRNAVDSETTNAVHVTSYGTINSIEKPQGKITLGYMSGSKAHEADFATAYEDIGRLLKSNRDVSLNVMGHSDMVRQLKKMYPKQVSFKKYGDYYSYIDAFRSIDLNLIPLVPDDFNDCKSAIRLMEAALLGVPTLVSNIGDYSSIGTEGETAYFVSSHDSWFDKIMSILDLDHLRSIGERAKQKVNSEFPIKIIGNGIDSELIERL